MAEPNLPTIKELPDGVIQDWRKKPVTIQAVQWDGTMYTADFMHQWSRGEVTFDRETGYLTCHTLEGQIFETTVGNWLICGVKGEFYFCRDDIFKETYDKC